MNVVVVEPGYLPYEKEINGLSEMQAVVGGYITATYPYENEAVSIVANDEGLLLNLPFNRSIPRRLRRYLWHIFHLRYRGRQVLFTHTGAN